MDYSKLLLFLKRMGNRARNRFVKRNIIVLGIVISVLLIIFSINKNKSNADLEIGEVTRDAITQSISASGKIESSKKAELSFLVSGRLAWVGVSEGSLVRRGQLVAQLDEKQMELELRKLLNSFEREFTEFDDSNESLENLTLEDSLKRIRERAQIDLNQSVLDVEIKNEVIKNSRLIAPINGIVTSVNPSVSGVNVTVATSSYVIVSPDSLYFQTDVNEIDIPKIFVGQKVNIVLDAFPGDSIESKVEAIGFEPVVTSTGGTAYRVKLNLTTKNYQSLKLGMKGDVEFVLEEKSDILTVSTGALVEENGLTYVWKLNEESKLQKVEIKTGVSSFDKTEVVSGLSEGDFVVESPGLKAKEGLKVKR